MGRLSLCDIIIKLDRNIRFVGVVNNRGEVIEGGFKQGIEPLLSGTDEQQLYIHSLANLTMLQSYSDRLGMVRYSLTEHERVILMTFPLGNGSILCLSATPKTDTIKIRDKITKVLKSTSVSASVSISTNSNKPTRKYERKKPKTKS